MANPSEISVTGFIKEDTCTTACFLVKFMGLSEAELGPPPHLR